MNLYCRNFPLRSTDPFGTVATCDKKQCSGESPVGAQGGLDPEHPGETVDGSIHWCYPEPRFYGDPLACDNNIPIIYTQQTFCEYLFKNFYDRILRNEKSAEKQCASALGADSLDWECPIKCPYFETRYHLGVRIRNVKDVVGNPINACFVTCNVCVTCKCKRPKRPNCVCSRYGCTCW